VNKNNDTLQINTNAKGIYQMMMMIIIIIIMSLDNVVDVVTKLQAERPGVRVPAGSRLSLFPRISRPDPGPTQPHIQ
jgi:hypothetical protein